MVSVTEGVMLGGQDLPVIKVVVIVDLLTYNIPNLIKEIYKLFIINYDPIK